MHLFIYTFIENTLLLLNILSNILCMQVQGTIPSLKIHKINKLWGQVEHVDPLFFFF